MRNSGGCGWANSQTIRRYSWRTFPKVHKVHRKMISGLSVLYFLLRRNSRPSDVIGIWLRWCKHPDLSTHTRNHRLNLLKRSPPIRAHMFLVNFFIGKEEKKRFSIHHFFDILICCFKWHSIGMTLFDVAHESDALRSCEMAGNCFREQKHLTLLV